MPRPIKCRKVCQMPRKQEFFPNDSDKNEFIVLAVDEYETIRLIDYENFSQEECANYMAVARTTAQQIYNNARKKIATALVEGIGVKIEGGSFRLCGGEEEFCNCGGCMKHRNCRKRMEELNLEDEK